MGFTKVILNKKNECTAYVMNFCKLKAVLKQSHTIM
jgi:hypothetical protein